MLCLLFQWPSQHRKLHCYKTQQLASLYETSIKAMKPCVYGNHGSDDHRKLEHGRYKGLSPLMQCRSSSNHAERSYFFVFHFCHYCSSHGMTIPSRGAKAQHLQRRRRVVVLQKWNSSSDGKNKAHRDMNIQQQMGDLFVFVLL